MPKRLDPELRARAACLVGGHHAEYLTETAAVVAVAKQLRRGGSPCAVGRRRPGGHPGPAGCDHR